MLLDFFSAQLLLILSMFTTTYLYLKFELLTILCPITLFEILSKLLNFDDLTINIFF